MAPWVSCTWTERLGDIMGFDKKEDVFGLYY